MKKLATNCSKLLDVSILIRLRRFSQFSRNFFISRDVTAFRRCPLMKNLKQKSAFTLVEMVVAMTIFTIFISMVAGTYLYIARGQRDAGEVRKIYSGARDVMEEIQAVARQYKVYYEYYDGSACSGFLASECSETFNLSQNAVVSVLAMINDDENELVFFRTSEVEENYYVLVREYELNEFDEWIYKAGYETEALPISTSDISVVGLNFRIFPDSNDYEYQPFVTVFMTVSGNTLIGDGFEYDLQTTISTRLYD